MAKRPTANGSGGSAMDEAEQLRRNAKRLLEASDALLKRSAALQEQAHRLGLALADLGARSAKLVKDAANR
jgi:hypothetical protein